VSLQQQRLQKRNTTKIVRAFWRTRRRTFWVGQTSSPVTVAKCQSIWHLGFEKLPAGLAIQLRRRWMLRRQLIGQTSSFYSSTHGLGTREISFSERLAMVKITHLPLPASSHRFRGETWPLPPTTPPTTQSSAPTGCSIRVTYKRASSVFTTKVMKPVIIGGEAFPGGNTTDAVILNIIQQTASSIYHAAATCAMGDSTDPMAVVDSKARVIDVSGLRVVDASAFPFLPPGHPQATVCELQLAIIYESCICSERDGWRTLQMPSPRRSLMPLWMARTHRKGKGGVAAPLYI